MSEQTMRIGILADIHGDIERLQIAIERLRRLGVDRLIVLGDLICEPANSRETVDILVAANAVGVWGNHELGLCVDPDEEIRELFDEEIMRYFSTLDSHLVVGEMLLSHTFPDQDARDPLAYYLGRRLEQKDACEACFTRFPQRLIFIGHFHRWFAATPQGRLDWSGESTLKFLPGVRYFVVIHSVMHGWCAIVDDVQNELVPIAL